MSNLFIQRKIIYEQILNEIGELNVKEKYNFKFNNNLKAEFETSLGLISVTFLDATNNETLIKKQQWLKGLTTFSVGYNLNGNDVQFAQAEYKELIKIFTTVCDIIIEFVKNNNPDVILVS